MKLRLKYNISSLIQDYGWFLQCKPRESSAYPNQVGKREQKKPSGSNIGETIHGSSYQHAPRSLIRN